MVSKIARTREPQYAECFAVRPVALGPMSATTWHEDPRRLGMVAARYKFVAKMLDGAPRIAEIGCGDGFMARIVAASVGQLALYDFDPAFVAAARECAGDFAAEIGCHDIRVAPLASAPFDAVYLLDVLEHVSPAHEAAVLRNIAASLTDDGVCIIGMPSFESQAYASPQSKAGHVNCKSGDDLRALARQFFRNVFLFGMNDEVLHTGFAPMCHYVLVLCAGPRYINGVD